MSSERATAPLLGAILPEMGAQDSFGAIEELSSLMAEYLSGENAMKLTAVALARESLASTYLECEIALPHARMADSAPFCVSVGRSRKGIPWGAEGHLAHLVFLSVVPASFATSYLGFIRSVALLMKDKTKREALLSQPDDKAMKQWLRANLALI
jgi:mannitol/fructose-specific phosphotransferase system IIA component (Ntr-type)